MTPAAKIKPVIWIGSSKGDLIGFPEEVVGAVGYALFQAQQGREHPSAKPLHGFGGAGVLEVVEDQGGDTYRAVYTVRLADFVYVLHAFQKKSKSGVKTPKAEIDLVKARLRRAEEHYAEMMRARKGARGYG